LEAPVVTDDLDAHHEISSSSNNSSRVELSPDDILLAVEREVSSSFASTWILMVVLQS
jgi:hypothetical protein